MATDIFRQMAKEVFNCGKCLSCRRTHAQQLAMRSVLTSSLYLHNSFLTLTYDETLSGYTNEKTYRDIQLFKKRLRKYCDKHFRQRLEIFNVMEYGKNGKKHWHLLVFGFAFQHDRTCFGNGGSHPIYISQTLVRLWGLGHCTIGDVSLGSALYQAQYTQKDIKNNATDSRKSTSRHTGLGRNYFLKNYKQIFELGYLPFGGTKAAIPRYFLKIAHKHYAHFYDRSYFYQSTCLKTRYSHLCASANKEIADLYKNYLEKQKEFVHDKRQEWESQLGQLIYKNKKSDFVKSGENALYDLKNKLNREIF
jgi:hypothetical protein